MGRPADVVARYLHTVLLAVLHPIVAIGGAFAAYEVVRVALRFVDCSWQTRVGVSTFAALTAGSYLFLNPQRYRRAFEVSLYPFLLPIIAVGVLGAIRFPEPYERYRGGFMGLSVPVLYLAGITLQSYRARVRVDRDPEQSVIQGARMVSFEEAKRRAAAIQPPAAPGVIRWGGLDLAPKLATEHFSIVGSSGSGKSVYLSYLMKSVLKKMAAGENCRMVVYDSKRNLLGQIREMAPDVEIRILNPFDARTHVWDVAADFHSEIDIVEAAQTFFPKPSGPSDEFFYLAPQGMLAGVITGLQEAAPGRWTLRDALAAFESRDTLERVMRFAESKNRDRITGYLSDPDPNRDIFITVANQIQSYRAAAAAWAKLFASAPDRRLSLTSWMEGNYVLLIPGNPRNPSSVAAVNRIILRRLFQLVLGQEASEDPRYWFFLDEFGTMGKLEGIQHFLFESRVRGAAVALGFQDVASLEDSYGRPGLAQIMQGTANIGALALRGNDVATWAENYFGTQYVVTPSHSRGTTTTKDGVQHSEGDSESPKSKPLLYGADFQQLAFEGNDAFPGFFNTARVGIYKHRLLKSEAASDVPHTGNKDAGNFVPCDPSLPVFQFWTDEERTKFGLPPLGQEPSAPRPKRPAHYTPGGLRGNSQS